MPEFKKFIKYINKEKYFLGVITFILLLQLLTYPSIYHIIDEKIFLDIGKNICNFNFSDFFGPRGEVDYTHNVPLYQTILCLTSPIHGFNVEKAEIITYSFFILLTVGWYYSIPKEWKIDKKKFTLLLFSNSLLWVYSFRALVDVPLAFFLSLGIFNLFLFLQYKKSKNYYLALTLLSLALLTKESAILFVPIFFVYLIIKRMWNFKYWLFVLLPLIPWGVFTFLQYLSGFPVLKEYFDVAFKVTTTHTYYSLIPYARFPTILFMLGIFGVGIISCIWVWKNSLRKENVIKNFLIFSLVFYIIWEVIFDFIIFANIPRYHTTLIPFFSLVITIGYKENKILRYFFYLTLIYTLITGFLAGYYFHAQETAIWKISLKDFLTSIVS